MNDLNQWIPVAGGPVKCPACGSGQKVSTRDDGRWSCGECCEEWESEPDREPPVATK